MSSKGKQSAKAGRSAIADVVSREYTINLHKRVSRNRASEEVGLVGSPRGFANEH